MYAHTNTHTLTERSLVNLLTGTVCVNPDVPSVVQMPCCLWSPSVVAPPSCGVGWEVGGMELCGEASMDGVKFGQIHRLRLVAAAAAGGTSGISLARLFTSDLVQPLLVTVNTTIAFERAKVDAHMQYNLDNTTNPWATCSVYSHWSPY